METRITNCWGASTHDSGWYGVDRREHTGICGIQCRSSRPDRRGSAPIDYLREQIRICKEKTQNPFGVNIMLMSPNADDLAQLVIDEKVPIVTTGAGNPGKYMERGKMPASR